MPDFKIILSGTAYYALPVSPKGKQACKDCRCTSFWAYDLKKLKRDLRFYTVEVAA